MTVSRVIISGRPVVKLQIPDVRALEKARDVALQVALLGEPLGNTIVESIDELIGPTPAQEQPLAGTDEEVENEDDDQDPYGESEGVDSSFVDDLIPA